MKKSDAPAAEKPATKLYKVRDHFAVHLADGEVYEAGELVELTDTQADAHAVQIEPAEPAEAPKDPA
jgi:hypothetical protein